MSGYHFFVEIGSGQWHRTETKGEPGDTLIQCSCGISTRDPRVLKVRGHDDDSWTWSPPSAVAPCFPESMRKPATKPATKLKQKSIRWGEPAKAAGKRLVAWVIVEHNNRGLMFEELVFLPEGVEPETEAEWRRMPWLDQPISGFRLGGTVVTPEQLIKDQLYETFVPTPADADIIGTPLAQRLAEQRCNAWSYPGHASWNAKLDLDGTRCALEANHQGPHAASLEFSQRLEPSQLETYYGEGGTNAAGKQFHRDCGGEVYFIEDGAICSQCYAQSDNPEPVAKPNNTDTDTDIINTDIIKTRVARVLNDRKGYQVDCLDEETRNDLLGAIVSAVLGAGAKPLGRAAKLLAERNAEIDQLRERVKQSAADRLGDLTQLAKLRGDVVQLISERDEARKASLGNSERAHQASQASSERARLAPSTWRLKARIARVLDEKLGEETNEDLLAYDLGRCDERIVLAYDLGRCDERIGVGPLLADAEKAIIAFIYSSARDRDRETVVVERIRAYRKRTEEIRKAGIERGWYPK